MTGLSLRTQLALLTSSLVLLTVAASTLWLFGRFERKILDGSYDRLLQETNEQKLQFLSHTGELKRDVRFLAGTPPIQGIIRARDGGGKDPKDGSTEELWKHRLETIFLNLARSKPLYRQVRFIGLADGGREIVRIDRQGPGGSLRVVPEDEFAQKAKRAYFEESIKGSPNQVFLSRIELNREKGIVSTPQIPVLRAAVPVYTDENRPFGILIINQDMQTVFESLERMAGDGHRFYITNAEGEYLYHPHPDRTFRFEFGASSKATDEFKSLQETLSQRSLADGTFLLCEDEPTEKFLGFRSLDYGRGDDSLGLLLAVEKDQLLNAALEVKSQAYLILTGLVGFSSIVGLVVGGWIAKPVADMADAIQEFENSGKVMDLPVNASAEAGYLARAFTSLARKVSEQREILRQEVRDREHAEREAKALVDSASDAIVTIDDLGTILTFNRRAEEIFGYAQDEVVGRNVSTLMRDRDATRHQGYLDAFRRRGHGTILGEKKERLARRKDGSLFEIELTIGSVESSPGRTFIGILRDVSDRARMDRELREANMQLLYANEELEEFTRAASHDLQAPLRSVLGFTELLKESLEDRLTEDELELMGCISEGGTRMRTLINSLLKLSQLSESEHSSVSLNEVYESVVSNLHSEIEDRGATVTRDDLPRMKAHEPQLCQLLQNLIGNSLKYAHPDRHPRIHVGAVKRAGVWHFFVKDNGMGIHPDHQTRVFEIFQRLHPRDEISGSGVGLALCRKVIERHRGRIWIESTLGEGATFWFTLGQEESSER